jgi:hypothetical protein
MPKRPCLITVTACLALAIVLSMALSPKNHPVDKLGDSKGRARDLAEACILFAKARQDHKSPQHFAVLVMQPRVGTLFLNTPVATHTTPPRIHTDWTVEKNWLEITAEVDSHCDYVYLGDGLSYDEPAASHASQIVFFYSKQPFVAEGKTGRIVAFMDGHVDFLPETDLTSVLSRSESSRRPPDR